MKTMCRVLMFPVVLAACASTSTNEPVYIVPAKVVTGEPSAMDESPPASVVTPWVGSYSGTVDVYRRRQDRWVTGQSFQLTVTQVGMNEISLSGLTAGETRMVPLLYRLTVTDSTRVEQVVGQRGVRDVVKLRREDGRILGSFEEKRPSVPDGPAMPGDVYRFEVQLSQ